MKDRLDWETDGRDWPNREASRFVTVAGFTWHVQVFGSGPSVLLLHGTGAATHSWRGLAPALARRFTVIAPDLPGHGFTSMPAPDRLSLPQMARGVGDLLKALDIRPSVVVGHSAGAAILARMVLNRMIAPDRLISLNGALLPFRGLPATLFSPAAKLLASVRLVPRLFTLMVGDRASVERLIRDTGSVIDPAGIEFYGRLLRNPGHVAGALGMMANWDLGPLQRDLPRLRIPVTLISGRNDRTLSPMDALRIRAILPEATAILLPGLGHLAHEERPKEVADLITQAARLPAIACSA